MEKKINIAELLKDCPMGMELDCTITDGGVTLEYIELESPYPINVVTKDGFHHKLSKYGEVYSHDLATCVIFPKGKTTWEGFVPPCQFKDGDIIVHNQNDRFVMSVYHKRSTDLIIKTHCVLWDRDEGLSVNKEICCYNDSVRFATEEEKQKLFQAIKEHGYKWYPESKTLKKFIESKEDTNDEIVMSGIYFDRENYADEVELHLGNYEIEVRDGKTYAVFKNQETKISKPIFKVGDKIKHKNTVLTITTVQTNSYIVEDEPDNFGLLMFSQQDKWELINEQKFKFKVDDKVKLKGGDEFGIITQVTDCFYTIKCKNNTHCWPIAKQDDWELINVPKFKVGDRIVKKNSVCVPIFITKVNDEFYYTKTESSVGFFRIQEQDDWELFRGQFDITTLKPFDSKVLVRNANNKTWRPTIFGCYRENKHEPFYVLGGTGWKQCIPYEENKHLLGTTDDCDDYYKTW